METIKAEKVQMVNSDTAASKLLEKGWELVNTFSHGNVVAYILVRNCDTESDITDLNENDKKTD